MNKFKKDSDLKLLSLIFKILKKNNFSKIQYYPSKFSFLAIVKEYENILNILKKEKHLLFYFSLFPKIYRIFLNDKQKISQDIFFYNIPVGKNVLIKFLSKDLFNKLLKANFIKKTNNKFKFNISFVPYKNYIFLRDSYNTYQSRFDPNKSGNSVWMGADSIMFLRFLKIFLKDKNFKRTIEIGSGTGVVINSISKKSKFCEAIDYNKKAVKYTSLNSKFNKIKNVKTYYSNLFNKVKGKFDLIIANPWFVDLKQGGLEEAPFIINKLDKHLSQEGYFLMILNSYIKRDLDTAYSYFKKLSIQKKFDISIFVNGYSIETDRLYDYKKYGIDHYVSYNVIIKKNGSGLLKRYEASFYRKLRDYTFIKTYKFLSLFSS